MGLSPQTFYIYLWWVWVFHWVFLALLMSAYSGKETLPGKTSGHVMFYWHSICTPWQTNSVKVQRATFEKITSIPWAVRHSWLEDPCSRRSFPWATSTPKVCQSLTRVVSHTDLVNCVHSGFISRFVHARLQVSVCSGCDLFHPC